MTRARLAHAVWLGAALVLGGCAYYNGMYNANRLAARAESSEREGRTAEARSRWSQAAVHAESVVARHPRSRWADDALLLRGRALVHTERNAEALGVLERVLATSHDARIRDEGTLLLARANIAVRRPERAESLLTPLAASASGRVRDAAAWQLGRARLASGRPAEALVVLRETRLPDASLDIARAAVATSDSAVLRDVTTAGLRGAYDERAWAPLLDSAAARWPEGPVGALVDSLVARRDLAPGQRARLLLADGDRWYRAGQVPRAEARFDAARRTAPDSVEAREARVRLVTIALSRAETEDDLALARLPLSQVVSLGGAPAVEATRLLRMLTRLDSLAASAVLPDAGWLLRAEVVRDSLRARALAGRLFGAMHERFPGSPWTPKGLIAAIDAPHPAADSLRALLEARYGESPYLAAALGTTGDPARFAALEDSLRIAVARLSGRPAEGDTQGDREPRQARPRPQAQPGRPQPGRDPIP